MKSGQAMLEYVLVLAGMFVVSVILWNLVRVSVRYSERAENLVTADSP